MHYFFLFYRRSSHTSAFTNATCSKKKMSLPQLPSHAFLDSGEAGTTGGLHSNGWYRASNHLDSINHPRFPLDSQGIQFSRMQTQVPEWTADGSNSVCTRGPPSSSTETPTPTATPTPTPTPIPGKFLVSSEARKGICDVVGSVYHSPWFQAFLPRDVALELLAHEEVSASTIHRLCFMFMFI